MDNHPLMKLLLNLEFYKAEVPKLTVPGTSLPRCLTECSLSAILKQHLGVEEPILKSNRACIEENG